jgi:hypothetical protein
MTPRVGKIWLTIALGICGLSSFATAQRAGAGNLPVYEACASANLSGPVAPRAPERNSTPFLSLCDGHALSNLSLAGQGQPVALASADFDGDGVPDLVSGFSTGKTGKITIHRVQLERPLALRRCVAQRTSARIPSQSALVRIA